MSRVHDLIGIGLGPFNLGLAALAAPVDDLDAVFLEARDRFDWHPGMMLPDATLQVPFLADLVTLADPTSPYSFLAYLKATGRLYPFYIRESFYPLRREYSEYGQWVAEQLDSVRFSQRVTSVEHDGDHYRVTTSDGTVVRGRRLVLGTGTDPHVPPALAHLRGHPRVVHSADYLGHADDLRASASIAVVGSGQSAAEIYADLLDGVRDHGYSLSWVTRSPRFFPMEYTKLTLEMTSPEYTGYFQGLDADTRAGLLASQRSLYKGISGDTIDAIFDRLYTLRSTGDLDTTLLTATAVEGATVTSDGVALDLRHVEQGTRGRLEAASVVLATGYRAGTPSFLDGVADRLRLDDAGRYLADSDYCVDDAGEVFVQNAEEHTHGFVAPDLGMGAYRNSVILARITGREVYPIEKRIAVQEFGMPDRLRVES